MNSPACKQQSSKDKYFLVPPVFEHSHMETLAEWINTSSPNEFLNRKMKLIPALYKEPMIKQPFHKWSDLIDIKTIAGGKSVFYLKNTTKRILPRSSHLRYIYRAHYGSFFGKKLRKKLTGDEVHRNFRLTKQWVCTFFFITLP